MEMHNTWFSVSPFRTRNGVAARDLDRLLAGMAIPTHADVRNQTTGFVPPLQLVDVGEQLVLTVEVPGIGITEIDVEVEPTAVTLRGEKSDPQLTGDPERSVVLAQRRWGAFEQTVRLPTEVNSKKATASMKNGVLTISLPKQIEKPKKLTIQDEN